MKVPNISLKDVYTGALAGLVVGLTQVFVAWNPEEIMDWRVWTIAAVGSIARTIASSVLARIMV